MNMKASDSGYETIKHVDLIGVDDEYVDELYEHTQPPVSGPAVFGEVVVPSIDKVCMQQIL